MPLTKKGHKIMAAMKEQYGEEEGERVFYASANAGKITGVHAAKDGVIAVADADGRLWTRALALADDDTEFILDKGVVPSRDGYLKAHARVARVGVQKYRGYEVGLPDRESVVLYRPPEEVFARDSMRSHANKPVTLTHPNRMVDKTTWGKVAKGFSGNEVVRDGEFVRVPLMLTDAKAIDAYENGVRELSVGYTTDIDWTAGTTPKGEAYDGVQREIRTNHHALVPVARGGSDLNLDDAASVTCPNCGAATQPDAMTCPSCGYDLKPTPRSDDPDAYKDAYPEADLTDRDVSEEERKSLAKKGHALPHGGFPIKNRSDLGNAIQAFGRAKNPAATKALIKRRAKELGAENMLPENWTADAAMSGLAEEEGVMPAVIKMFDGLPISFADEVSAAAMEREFRKLQLQLADAGDFGGKKAPPFKKKGARGDGNGDNADSGDGNGSDDRSGDDGDSASDIEAKRRKVSAEDALKIKDGEIAVLRRQLRDAGSLDAKAEILAEQRIALLDAARALLPKDFKDKGMSLADIRRAAVSTQFSDAEIKDWDDAQFIGAFAAMTKTPQKTGARALADGMTHAMRAIGSRTGGTSLADAEAEAAKAHAEYVQRITDGYKEPFKVVRN